MKFPQLRASLEDFMNPDTTAGGFLAFLGLVQQLQLRKTGSKMSGQARRLFFSSANDANGANDANEANSPK